MDRALRLCADLSRALGEGHSAEGALGAWCGAHEYSPAVHRAALSADALSVRPCRRERADGSAAHAAALLRFSGCPRRNVRPTDCIFAGRSTTDRAAPELGITAALRDLPACRPMVRLLDRRAGDCAAFGEAGPGNGRCADAAGDH